MLISESIRYAFNRAIDNGDLPALTEFLKDPEIIEYMSSVSLTSESTLARAAGKGNADSVRLLLGVPAVYASAGASDNSALCAAVLNDDTDVMKLLLDVPSVRSDASTLICFLEVVARRGHIDAVRLFLRSQPLIKKFAVGNHAALSAATSKNHWDIILLLLQHYGTHSIPLYYFTRILRNVGLHPAATDIKAILLNHVITYYKANVEDKVLELNLWLEHWGLPSWQEGAEINDITWCDYLFNQAAICQEPKQAAIILLSLNEMARNHQREARYILPVPNIDKRVLVAYLRLEYMQEFKKALTAGFIACANPDQAFELHDALSMLSKDNAWDVISKPGQVHCGSLVNAPDDGYNLTLLKKRQAFIADYLPMKKLYDHIQAAMLDKYGIIIESADRVFIQAILTNIGGGNSASYITSAYQKRTAAFVGTGAVASNLVLMSGNADSVESAVISSKPSSHNVLNHTITP